MSHTEKFCRAAVGQLGAHIDRERGDDHQYGNANINRDLSGLNYDLSSRRNTPLSAIVSSVIDAAPKTVRRDAVVLGCTVTTLPSNWPDDRDPAEFFAAVRAFDLQFWPDSYIEARATVHMDESRPHMHHAFVPLDDAGMPAWSRTYTRAMYRQYHRGLEEYVRGATHLPDLRILIPDEERGERQLSKLGQEEYIEARGRLERLRAGANEAEHAVGRDREANRAGATHLRELEDEARGLEADVRELEQRARGLELRVLEARGHVAVLRERCGRALEALRAALRAVQDRLGLTHVEHRPSLDETLSRARDVDLASEGVLRPENETARQR